MESSTQPVAQRGQNDCQRHGADDGAVGGLPAIDGQNLRRSRSAQHSASHGVSDAGKVVQAIQQREGGAQHQPCSERAARAEPALQKAFQKDGHGQRKQRDLQQRKPGYAGKNPLQPAKGIDIHPMEIQVKIRRAARLKARHGAQDELVIVGGKVNVAEAEQKAPQKRRNPRAPKPAASGAVAMRQAVQPPLRVFAA